MLIINNVIIHWCGLDTDRVIVLGVNKSFVFESIQIMKQNCAVKFSSK